MPAALSRPVDIFIATHTAEAYGPQYVLRQHLIEQGVFFAYVGCPFDYARLAHAELAVYREGKTLVDRPGHHNTARGVLSWLRDAWFVFRQGWKYLGQDSVFIGINNLNAVVGILLKWLGKGKCVVYYVIDYTPTRFPSRLINGIYQSLARFAARRADMVWNLSERMRDVHARFGARPDTSIMVPIGLHAHEFQVVPEEEIKRNQLIVVSTLFESKGVHLAIDAMTHLPAARLTIVGTGPYEGELKERAERLGVADRITFLGLADRTVLFDRLSHSRVALAPYQTDPANYSYYADPAKPKEYLACGIPVVITRVPWIAEEIERRPMGLAIGFDSRELARAAEKLMTDDAFWSRCRQEAIQFSRDLLWQDIFGRALAALAALPDRARP